MSQIINRAIKYAAGCVVYRYDGAAPLILLIRDKYGRWTLPKGHLKPDEHEQAAAVREVLEETGLAGELGPLVDRIAYQVVKGEIRREKQVVFFLLHAAHTQATPQAAEGISAAEWLTPDLALARIGYPLVREVLARAIEMLPQAQVTGSSRSMTGCT